MTQDDDEKKDEKLTLQELINLYGWVLHHPILGELVKAAPSPKSVDNYIVQQFNSYPHKNELAKAVKNAVRIRDRTKSDESRVWKELLEAPEGHRLSDMFIFKEESQFKNQGDDKKIYFSSGIKFLPDPAKAIDCSEWPLLLKELKIGDKTSIDYYGSSSRFWVEQRLNNFYWNNNRIAKKNRKHNDYVFEIFYINQEDSKNTCWHEITCSLLGISGRIVKVMPQKGEIYPRFYKTLSLCDNDYAKERQTIDIIFPIDTCNENKKGKLVFRKDIGLTGNKNCGSVNELIATLELKFDIGNNFYLQPIGEYEAEDSISYIQIRSISGQPSLLFQEHIKPPEDKEVREVISMLLENFVAAWPHCLSKNINMSRIVGADILTHPPKTLLSLFSY